MNYNMAKEIGFFTGKEVGDSYRVARRMISLDENIGLEEIYATKLLHMVILGLAFKSFRREDYPYAKLGEILMILELPLEKVKEFVLTTAMTYYPDSVYAEMKEDLVEFMTMEESEGKQNLNLTRGCVVSYCKEIGFHVSSL